MEIFRISAFKDPKQDLEFFENWVTLLEHHNQRNYERFEVFTDLGKTHVWGVNTQDHEAETLVIFPGARTTSLIWDFDRGLDHLGHKLRVFLVETNGLPNLSDGATPDIRSLDYGQWAGEVMEHLSIEKAYVAGASFGGLICMKLGIVHPEKVKAAFLLNAGCLQPFSLNWKNLYYNILPIVNSSQKNVLKFLNNAIFSKPNHQLSTPAEKMLIDYEIFAISRYLDSTQKPYYMDKQLANVQIDTYLLQGDRDLLFPFQQSIRNGKKHLKNLKGIRVFKDIGHGIETHDKAIQYIGETIKSLIA